MAASRVVAVWWPRAWRWARALPRGGNGTEAASSGSSAVAAEVAMGTVSWPGAGNGARAVKLGDSKGTFKLCRRGAGSKERVVL